MKKTFQLLLLLSVFFTITSCAKKQINSPIPSGNRENKVHLLLYFPDKNAIYLIPEDRYAPLNDSFEKTVVLELLKGPSDRNKNNPIPKGTKLLSIAKNNDLITVNFSKEITKNHPGGSTGEMLTVYSIVNSLTEIPGVKKVKFQIEGKDIITLAGHLAMDKPLTRNRDLLNRNKRLSPSDVVKLQMGYEIDEKWLNAYILYSDDENNLSRLYYNDYILEMENTKAQGFITGNYTVDNYIVDKTGNKAQVKVHFKDLNKDINISTIKIGGVWLVDWSAPQ
jgi:hypothetical protein